MRYAAALIENGEKHHLSAKYDDAREGENFLIRIVGGVVTTLLETRENAVRMPIERAKNRRP